MCFYVNRKKKDLTPPLEYSTSLSSTITPRSIVDLVAARPVRLLPTVAAKPTLDLTRRLVLAVPALLRVGGGDVVLPTVAPTVGFDVKRVRAELHGVVVTLREEAESVPV